MRHYFVGILILGTLWGCFGKKPEEKIKINSEGQLDYGKYAICHRSLSFFKENITPILAAKCLSCHRSKKGQFILNDDPYTQCLAVKQFTYSSEPDEGEFLVVTTSKQSGHAGKLSAREVETYKKWVGLEHRYTAIE